MLDRRLFRRLAMFLFIVLTSCILAGCAAAPEESAEEVVPVRDTSEENLAAIRALVASYAEQYNAGDEDALAELFTEDSLLMPPDEGSVEGRLLIRNRFATIFATYDGSVQVNVDETRFSGDFAIARGTWALTLTPKDGGDTISEVGKWLNMIEREDGRWKISRNIWNRDQTSAR